MSNLPINPLEYSYEDARNVAAYISLAVLPSVALFAVRDTFAKQETAESGVSGGNDVLIKKAAEEKKGRLRSGLRKWGAPLLLSASFAGLGGQLLDPVFEETTVNNDASVMIVLDQSYPMYYAKDMEGSETRSEASISAITEVDKTIPSKVKVGIVAYGSDAAKLLEPTTDRTLVAPALKDTKVDSNGTNLDLALTRTQDIFDGGDTTKNLVIITDGIISNSATVGTQLAEATKEKQNVTVILTGTETGTYVTNQFDKSPKPAGVTASPFEQIQGVKIVKATSEKEISDAIKVGANVDTTTTTKKPVRTFLYGIMAFGMPGISLMTRDKRRNKR